MHRRREVTPRMCITNSKKKQPAQSHQLLFVSHPLTSKHLMIWKLFSSLTCSQLQKNCSVFYSKGSFGLLLCRLEEVGGAGWRAHFLLYVSFRALWLEVARTRGHKANDWVRQWERRSKLWALTLAMPASSCLLHWMAGSEVSVEVKLSLADKQAAINTLLTRGSAFRKRPCAVWALFI